MENFISELKEYRCILPKNMIKTLRGQALSGDVNGAKKGLKKLKRKVHEGGGAYGNSRSKFKKRKSLKDQ